LVLEDILGDRAQIQSSKNALEVATITQEEVMTVLRHFLDCTVRRMVVSFYAPSCGVANELVQLLAGDLVVVTNIEPVSKHETTVATPPNINSRSKWSLQWFPSLHRGNVAIYLRSFADE
jgi:hypothetical protein